MRRPALPRASSATSGFFFCGSIDEPVPYASARRHEPELLARPQHDLLAEAREVHLRERERRTAPRRRSRGRTRRRASSRSGGRSRGSAATPSGSSGRLEPASAPAPSGDTSARAQRVAPAVDVAAKRPEVREQMVREQHRLRALQVRVAGEVDVVAGLVGAATSTSWSVVDAARRPAPRVAGQPQVGGDLVVAAPAGVELRAGGAGELGDAALDRRVDVLVGRRRTRTCRPRAPRRPRSSAASTSVASSSVSEPDARRACATCAREPSMSSGARRRSNEQADGEGQQRVGRAFGEAAVPERARIEAAGRPSRPALGSCRRATSRPRGPTAARSRRRPRGGSCRGLVGRELVVVEARSARRPATLHCPARARSRTSPVTCRWRRP